MDEAVGVEKEAEKEEEEEVEGERRAGEEEGMERVTSSDER